MPNTNSLPLRPYQQRAKEQIHTEWEQGRLRTLLVLPTGTGKTIVFAAVAEDQVRAGDRVLILAHRGELLEQAADKLQKSTGLGCAVEKAEQSCLASWYRVVVGSVQSLQRPQRLEKFPHNYFSTIIIDEAHHAVTDGYRRILDWFPAAKVLGVTATPDRGDLRNLGEVFDSLAYEYKLTDAIRDGFLCRIMAQTIPLRLDISTVGMSGGDYAVGELGSRPGPLSGPDRRRDGALLQGAQNRCLSAADQNQPEIPGYPEPPRIPCCRGQRPEHRSRPGPGRF